MLIDEEEWRAAVAAMTEMDRAATVESVRTAVGLFGSDQPDQQEPLC